MIQVNMHEAKTHLSELVEKVEAGEEVVIARAGRPIARLVPFHPQRAPRQLGLCRGQIRIASDFDELPSDIERVTTSPIRRTTSPSAR
jgi:prevent-host-death family protein